MKKMFLKVLSIFLVCLLLLSCVGCSGEKKDDGKIKILCTLFPEYDWVRNIIGESECIELSLLVSNGSDIHSYEPTAADILKIADCDLLVYSGGDVSKWIEKALELTDTSEIKTVDMTKTEGVVLHEISSASEGEQGEHHAHDGHDHSGFDEHIWLSIENAMAITRVLAEEICALDGKNAESYRENAEGYIAELSALDKQFKAAAERYSETERFVLFADRFPFVYLLQDYNISYRAPFDGCSTDASADFETVLSLIKTADEYSCKYVALTESGEPSLAQTVISSAKRSDMETVVFYSMQNVGSVKIEEGVTYLGQMEKNLAALKKVLENR